MGRVGAWSACATKNLTNTGGPREQPIVESGVVSGSGGPWKTPNEPSRYPWAGAMQGCVVMMWCVPRVVQNGVKWIVCDGMPIGANICGATGVNIWGPSIL